MADVYCNNCKRMVGTKKNLTGGLVCIVIGVVLFLFIPLIGWLIRGILGLVGIILLIAGGKRCSVCGGKNLSPKEPEVSSASSSSSS